MKLTIIEPEIMSPKLEPVEALATMIAFASLKHMEQTDKGGNPYILHPMAVALMLSEDYPGDYELQALGWGHDLVEDCGVTYSELHFMGFSKRIIDGIRGLTKELGESKEEYRMKVRRHYDTIRVKKRDVTHNMSLKRLKGVTPKDLARNADYTTFYAILDKLEKWWDDVTAGKVVGIEPT